MEYPVDYRRIILTDVVDVLYLLGIQETFPLDYKGDDHFPQIT